ncbi:MAG: UDP-N-acetylmuramate--L-alanine ligase [Chitinophagaceae bacterium]|nr:UDP-N-acetylmuramate--L-alanine ligase [Chitinophagaceae bacterium]
MVNIKTIKKIYFIGIGGIGMSALARYFKFHGKEISGYDKTETTLTKELSAEGIAIHYDEDLEKAPKDAELVVYTPAVPREHKELLYYQANNYPMMKRSEVLAAITNSSFNICVAGTHGKTTITTMIAHILRHSGYGCNAFLGGIAVNYNSNFWSDERDVCVIEADEYDRSFLKLSPYIAVISAMDADHLDIYGSEAAMQQAFIGFAGKVNADGLLLAKSGLPRSRELKARQKKIYSLDNDKSDAYALNIRLKNGSYEFDIKANDRVLNNVTLQMGGMHNIENTVAAVTIAHHLGIEDDKIKKAVKDFKGIKRRFEYIIKTEQKVFIDDYAHHPEELKALITSAKNLFAGKKCTVVFQPHLYSRTKDFADGFAASLDLADEVLLLPVYPARELPIEGVNSGMIISKMKNVNKKLVSKEELVDGFKKQKPEMLITAGAGDIDQLVDPIKKILKKA